MLSMETYNLLSLLVFTAVMVIFPMALVFAGKVMGEYAPDPVKRSTFECGQVATGKAHMRFDIQYYPYAMIYAMFGALAVFLLLAAPVITALPLGPSRLALVSLVIVSIALMSASLSLRSSRGR